MWLVPTQQCSHMVTCPLGRRYCDVAQRSGAFDGGTECQRGGRGSGSLPLPLGWGDREVTPCIPPTDPGQDLSPTPTLILLRGSIAVQNKEERGRKHPHGKS